ncbi:MAG TPA: coproporphyrinogen III oxidase, partial [Planctomycetaceae bacterium]|nr:coproporphyrinogen III oxidase [Planctomycetaceae bacterium]
MTGRDDLVEAYLDALELELAQQLGEPRMVETLFLGGGTPSYLSGPQMQRLQVILGKWLPLEPGGEYSCEANPLDCTAEQLDLLRDSGVNRISLGGQSLSDRKLQVLERDHRSDDLVAAVHRCRERFPAVSLDLIFAAPGECLDEWRSDITRALDLPIQHVSAYGLTVERGSAFYGRVQKDELTEVDEDTQLEMYRATQAAAASKGFEQYEVSNYALPGHRCRHNETYWLGQPWWAVGPGAASFLPETLIAETQASQAGCSSSAYGAHLPAMHRRVNHRSTTTYIRRMHSGRS